MSIDDKTDITPGQTLIIPKPKAVKGQKNCIACDTYHGAINDELNCLRRALREARAENAILKRQAKDINDKTFARKNK